MMKRLDPKIDAYYENILNEPPVRQRRKFINPNFITSNSLFVQENESLEERLASRNDKLNVNENAPIRGEFSYPLWFKSQHETFNDLGKIQLQQIRYPIVAEIPSNLIKQQSILNPPKAVITDTDVTVIRNIIKQLS